MPSPPATNTAGRWKALSSRAKTPGGANCATSREVAKTVVISGSKTGRQLLEELGMTGLLVHRDATRPYETVETMALSA